MKNDDTTLATKGDLHAMKEEISHHFDGKLHTMKEEIVRHFDVAVEHIRHDLEGANKDEIEMLKDAKKDHEQRVVTLEQVAGLRA